MKSANIFIKEKKQSKSVEELLKNVDSFDEVRDIWFYNRTDQLIETIVDHRKYLFPIYADYCSVYKKYNIDDINTLGNDYKCKMSAVLVQDAKYNLL